MEERSAAPPRACLLVAHPGHELTLYGWLEAMRPAVLVMTDGSGSGGASRLAASRRLVEAVGAAEGPVFGRWTDREVYEALLEKRAPLFVDLAREIASLLVVARVEIVVADPAEGYNPVHDACRFVADAAVRLAARAGWQVTYRDYPLASDSGSGPEEIRVLDDGALERKRAAAAAYPQMRAEVETAVRRFGEDWFRVERLRPATPSFEDGLGDGRVAFYEGYGRGRVAVGVYRDVITRDGHLRFLAEALARAASPPAVSRP